MRRSGKALQSRAMYRLRDEARCRRSRLGTSHTTSSGSIAPFGSLRRWRLASQIGCGTLKTSWPLGKRANGGWKEQRDHIIHTGRGFIRPCGIGALCAPQFVYCVPTGNAVANWTTMAGTFVMGPVWLLLTIVARLSSALAGARAVAQPIQ